jgi:hypothetical protein
LKRSVRSGKKMPVEVDRTLAALDAMARRIGIASGVAGRKVALAFQAEGMANTKAVSGSNRRSWQTVVASEGPTVFSAAVGPTMVYSRRIELGFKGPDSLGRVYNQVGKPYVKPAYESVRPRALPLVVAEITGAIGV